MCCSVFKSDSEQLAEGKGEQICAYLTGGPAVAALLQRNPDLVGTVLPDKVNDLGALPVVRENRGDRERLHFH